jgi:hypothetical protein
MDFQFKNQSPKSFSRFHFNLFNFFFSLLKIYMQINFVNLIINLHENFLISFFENRNFYLRNGKDSEETFRN